MQLHTQLVRDADGRLVEVCTLNGIKTVVVDQQGEISTDIPQRADRSAAMALSDLMAEATSSFTLPYIPADKFASQAIQFISNIFIVTLRGDLNPIRAPPLLTA